MCGIVGIISKNKWNGNTESILEAIRHRGPDDEGIWRDDSVVLGQTRLSIQDLSKLGHQPMVSEDGRFVLIFNGELYNHESIRDELKILGHSFHSTSDTETLLHGLIQWGSSLLPRLNGIFALAFYDSQTQRLLVARDHFGIKPLYYFVTNEAFYFASELKALIPFVKQMRLDSRQIANYVQFLWCPGEGTPVHEIKKMLPGHSLEVFFKDESLQVNSNKFFQLELSGKYSKKTELEIIEELDQHLQQAVKRQLLSDVPVGFFLSGGLDSSLLVAMAKKITGKRIQCFTIQTDVDDAVEGFADDLKYARQVADHLGVDLEIVKAEIDMVKDFDKMIYHLDEPQADAAPLNVWNICKRSREMGYKVLIGGTAGDDLFSGYRRHQALIAERYFKLIPKSLGRWISKIPFNQKRPIERRISKILRDVDRPIADRLASYYTWLPYERLVNLFALNRREDLKTFRPIDYLIHKLDEIPNEHSWLNRMLYWEMTSFLVDHNLNYTDKMGMAHGVEIRVPYLDLDLVKYVSTIPPNLKLNGQETKYILKKVAERYLPREIIYRPKTGFGAPVRKWILNDLEGMINERLAPQRLRDAGVFSEKEVWQLINDNKAGTIDASYSIWSLLAIDSWISQFMKR